MSNNTKVLVCFNEPVKAYKNYIGKKYSSTEENVDLSETGISDHINDIVSYLQMYFGEVEALAFSPDVEKAISNISDYAPELIFNFVESVDGHSHLEAYAAGIYELLGVHYTGNTPVCLATCLDKSRTKLILNTFGINTPGFKIAGKNKKFTEEEFDLRFPVILKLVNEDASIGISEHSVVNSVREVNKRLSFLHKTYKQDVLIEEFIDGRELNVSVLGGKALPVSEISFDGLPERLPKIVTYEGKWSPESTYYKHTTPVCPAEIDAGLKEKVQDIAERCFEILNGRDYARVDMRIGSNGTPYVIEVNPNPDLSTDAGFARAASAAGMTYPELLYAIANFALERREYDKKA